MADLVRTQEQIEQQELESNKKLKPLLAQFVVNEQYKNAEKVAKENKKIADEKLSMETVKLQCARLSMRALFDEKFWMKNPLPWDMAWVNGKTVDGTVLSQDELIQERNELLGGFSSFLLDEYYNNQKHIQSGSYLHPLLEKNLEFFWNKFIADLKLIIRVDNRRRFLGNKGIVILDDDEVTL